MLQPFKFITVVMKEATNDGMVQDSTGTSSMQPIIKLKDDMRYHPITLNDEGYGAMFDSSNSGTHAVVGVLMESFNKTYAQHKVLVQGITPMKAKGVINPGVPVYWDYASDEVRAQKTDTAPYVGIAMTASKQDGDMIDVLIR